MQLDHLDRYYRQEEVSDVTLIIKLHKPEPQQELEQEDEDTERPAKRARHAAEPAAAGEDKVLVQFPAHRLVLFGTDYFKTQAQQAWAATDANSSPGRDAAAAAAGSSRPKLHLPIDSEEQLPAAEAVIAALYNVRDALSSLQQQQLVDAAVIADRLAILAADRGSRVQRMLLAVLGDLEAVWRDEQLQALLLQLPLPAAQLLLSSDDLRVASEDTVLYTATKYVKALQPGRQAARDALALLVRAPHLTRSALANQVLSAGHNLLMNSLVAPLSLLVSYRLIVPGNGVTADALAQIRGAPDSWGRGVRQLAATDGVRMHWRLPVEQLAAACRESFAGNKQVRLTSPASTPPLGGVAWRLGVRCKPHQPRNGAAGVRIGLLAESCEAPHDIFRAFSATFGCRGARSRKATCDDGSVSGCGPSNFFRVGTMSAAGGWDEAAWAAKGLPTAGELLLSLHMHSVG
uniref:BACK domain-containing protein n=1 Tax=Tetradesmus obliquus TaxID=3088 RepID=A0A383VJQ4_TETOB|eukprot:jgi/Sobl393_1/15620/SZX64606.1